MQRCREPTNRHRRWRVLVVWRAAAAVDAAETLAVERIDPIRTRYGSLQFLAWLLEGWPHGAGSRTARDLLARGLDQPANRIFRHLRLDWTNPRSPDANQIEPDIQSRLRELL